MQNPSGRLRRDQDRQNRQREHNRSDRRRFVGSLRSRWHIHDLTGQIEADERKRGRDTAFEAMSAGWREARAAIERCASVTPDIQASWLKRFDAIRYAGNSSVCRSLNELESEVDNLAASLSELSTDLRQAAASRSAVFTPALPGVTLFRKRTMLPGLMRSAPTRLPLRLHGGLLPTEMWPAAPGANRCADDLRPIHDRIMYTLSVPHRQRFEWIRQLDEIDRPGRGAAGRSATERIEALAGGIDAVAVKIRSVGATLGCQASRCGLFWR